jgi:hypothetical protein
MRVSTAMLLTLLLGVSTALGQLDRKIFDAHVHVGTTNERISSRAASLRENGIVKAVVIQPHWGLADSSAFDSDLFIPATGFPCPLGKQPNGGPPCFVDGLEFPSIEELRSAIESGNVRVLGEIYTQYFGISPDDDRMDSYWALAEEYDIPVGIHMSLAPPNSPYGCCPNYRAKYGDPQLLENILVRHPDLRVYIMHAGWPFIESTISQLYLYPQLYVDVAALQYVIPRKEYYMYLQRLVDMGYGDRIMWGSDGQVAEGIKAIEEADFLTEDQKNAIFYDNAARFFRLEE